MTNTCEDRIDDAMESRLDDLRTLAKDADWDGFAEYFLSVDYVAPYTFNDQPEGYIRMQISWGGPSDEFRLFVKPDHSIQRIEYVFLDWYDGAVRTVTAIEDRDAVEMAWAYFEEAVTPELPEYPTL